jgi:hypothetical protein
VYNLSSRDFDAAEALNDDVVSVVADYHHCHDGTGPKNGAQTSVQLARWRNKKRILCNMKYANS